MIDVMQNKVLGPMMVQQFEQGVSYGQHRLLLRMLAAKFGTLPIWTEKRLADASVEDLERWADRILIANSIEETLK